MPPGAVSLTLVLDLVFAAGTVAFIKDAKSTHGLIVAMFKVSFWYHLIRSFRMLITQHRAS